MPYFKWNVLCVCNVNEERGREKARVCATLSFRRGSDKEFILASR